ncbi:hypothetical protein KAT08_02405 [Candidatus Babeliales bacterium]|nr:hypothetical protein [Candidatus Babeliales bacterium]
MRIKGSFLLVEILLALSFFVISITAICWLHVESIKVHDFAVKRMLSLNIITNCIEKIKSTKKIDLFEKNKDFSINIEHLDAKTNEKLDFLGPKFVKITVTFKYFNNKTFKLDLIGTC